MKSKLFRIVPWVFLLIVTSLLSTGNSFAQTGDKIDIEIGALTLPPHMKSWFRSEIASFMKSNPDINVTTIAIDVPFRPYNTTIEKLPRLPKNIIGIQTYFGNEVDYLVDRDLIVPMDDFQPDDDLSYTDFFENAWSSVTHNDQIWGIPFIMDTFYLAYDKRAFANAGLKRPPKTWIEFVEYCKVLTLDVNSDGKNEQTGLYFPPGLGIEANLWATLDRQKGVRYLVNGKVNFDQPAIRENLEFLKNLYNSEHTDTYGVPSFGRQLGDGNSAMILMNNFVQHLPQVTNPVIRGFSNRNYEVAPLPTDGLDVFNSGNRLYFAVRKSTPEEQDASWKLIKWFNRVDLPVPRYWFGFPARKGLTEQPDYQKIFRSGATGYENLYTGIARSVVADIRFAQPAVRGLVDVLYGFLLRGVTLDETIQRLNASVPSFVIVNSESSSIEAELID